jgi:phosphatidylserine decarboxylase
MSLPNGEKKWPYIAEEGWPIIGSVFLAAALSYSVGRFLLIGPLIWFSFLAVGFGIFSLYFFRDPERITPEGDDLVICPADGTIVDIVDVDEPDFIKGRATRISIFMSPANVHVNRSPVSGVVRYIHYNPGEFQLAWREKASELNEQNSVGIEKGDSKYLVRQIAGYVARRIVCRVQPGTELSAGERFGLIRFGSRVDLFFVPGSIDINVKSGQAVTAGLTIIGVVQ